MEYYKLIEKECLFCGASLSGRSDKKYCDDNCRNNHHYNLNKDTNVLINKVNRILLHNRQLLKSLCRNAKIVVKKQKMKEVGFDFNYITGSYETKGGDSYRIVYDYAYKIVDEDVIVLRY